jgi:hypothetical protein
MNAPLSGAGKGSQGYAPFAFPSKMYRKEDRILKECEDSSHPYRGARFVRFD